jgi:CRISPR-associated protein Cmr2
MSNNAMRYRNALTEREGICHIAEGEIGKHYVDTKSGTPLLLHQNPLSQSLVGLALDEVEKGRNFLIKELKEQLHQAQAQMERKKAPLACAAETLSGTIAGRNESLSKEANAILNLPGDARPGKNQARLRDHSLIASGITSAISLALLIGGRKPEEICAINRIDEQEILGMARLASMCRVIIKHSDSTEQSQALIRQIFGGVLDDDVGDKIAKTASRPPLSDHPPDVSAPDTLLQEIICHADVIASGAEQPSDPGFTFPGYREVREWEHRIFGDEPALALIAADVDRVQSYVFESAKLAEMRGASLILDLLNVKDSDDAEQWGSNQIRGIPQVLSEEFHLPRECIIYAAGGGALIIAPLARAEQIKQRIEKLYVETTLTATITVVHRKVRMHELALGIDPPENWLDDKLSQAKGEAWRLMKHNLADPSDWQKCSDPSSLSEECYHDGRHFGQLRTALGYHLRREKDSKPSAPIFEVSPFTERCFYCHFRPAHTLASEIDERPICEACNQKRQKQENDSTGGSKRKTAHSFYITRFKDYLERETSRGKEPAYRKGVRGDIDLADWGKIESPPDLEAVAQGSANRKAQNFVGIIYADGNEMGAMLDTLKTPAAFKSFADEVRTEVEKAVFSSLGHLLVKHQRTKREQIDKNGKQRTREYTYHPFEIVSIGGDDVYLFVPADVALDMALHICRKVENAFDGKITLAAGVLIAHVTTPVYFSRNIVKGLLKNAKKLSKESNPANSAIDFQVITADTAISEDIAGFRDKAYKNTYAGTEWLTTRPLKLDDLSRMINLVRDLKEKRFPLAQLYSLREAAVRGPQPRATNYYNYQRQRSGETYDCLHEYLSKEANTERLPFWKPGRGLHKNDLMTPIADIVEIYDFVRDKSGNEGEESD